MMRLESEKLKQIVRSVMSTQPEEIGCDDCFEAIDRFVEMTLSGTDPAEAMPLVQAHLDRCKGCREEFEALLRALRSLD